MRTPALLLAVLVQVTVSAQGEPSLVTHRLVVAGEVQRELTLATEELRAIGLRRGMVEARGYSGVRLVDVLDEADIRRDAPRALRRTYVVATASDGYQAVFSWGELFNTAVGKGVVVAIERDGLPLRDGEGRFALISSADDKAGPRHVKWLARIDVRRIPEAGR